MERKDLKLQFSGNPSTSRGSRMNPATQMQAIPQSPDFGFDGNNDLYARQESHSLTMCSNLIDQEVDASIYEDMGDLTQYLANDDVPFSGNDAEFLEPMLQKQHAIYSDISVQQSLVLDNPPNYAILGNCDNPMDVPNNVDDRYDYRPQTFHFQPIKEENAWEDEQDMDSLVPGSSIMSDVTETVDVSRSSEVEFNMKPRKYNLKPEAVKKTPKYLDARKRNNLAVRKSRNKQKIIQAEKEGKLKNLETTINDYAAKVKEGEQRYATLKGQYTELQGRFKKMDEECKRLRNENEHLRNQLGPRGGGFGYRHK